MLTEIQKSMMRHHIGRLIDILEYLCVRLHNNAQGYGMVASLIRGAILNEYAQYPYNKSSLRTAATPYLVARELNGIFHPDFEVLSSLSIINNPRDTVKILREALHSLSNEIQNYSLQVLQKYLAMPRYLSLATHVDYETILQRARPTFQITPP